VLAHVCEIIEFHPMMLFEPKNPLPLNSHLSDRRALRTLTDFAASCTPHGCGVTSV
jgi:hypothetical protein